MTAASDRPGDPAAIGQEVATVDQTAACEASNCHRCRGTVYSLTSTHGRPCGHACHGGDDRAVEADLERYHFDDPFDIDYGES